MRTRKISVLTMTAVAFSLALTACGNNDSADTSSSPSLSPSSSSASSSATASKTPPKKSDAAEGTSASTPAKPEGNSGGKCTDRLDYAGDARSNAEINSIGEDTGTCPPVKK
ncbi:hypothetical protein AB0I16_10355 [Streptomyces sp. NPDC050703]|uniref:hypothetical protein n=1 Tax=Streptomyces sp. NPDC050703 TaxID=3157218 RepID=UPI003426EC28